VIALDSSSLVAILAGEPEAGACRKRIEAEAERVMSAFNLFETRTVLHRRFGHQMVSYLDRLIERWDIGSLPFDTTQARIAFAAYRKYGKGSGHKAQLNLGDCAAYALATSLDLPLLFKGDDFRHTDVWPALAN